MVALVVLELPVVQVVQSVLPAAQLVPVSQLVVLLAADLLVALSDHHAEIPSQRGRAGYRLGDCEPGKQKHIYIRQQ